MTDDLVLMSWPILTAGALAFLAGGLVKGVLGIGLPLVAVPILTHLMPLPTALALLAVPVLSSNVQQLWMVGRLGEVWARFSWLLLVLPLGVVVGTQGLFIFSPGVLNVMLGTLLLLFVVQAFFGRAYQAPAERERWLSPAVGFVAGLIGGVSSFVGPPIAAYLVALRVPKDLFIAATAASFLAAAVPLQGVLAFHSVLDAKVALTSLVGIVPVTVGVWLGERVRRRIAQEAFRKAVLALLALIGLSLVWRGSGVVLGAG